MQWSHHCCNNNNNNNNNNDNNDYCNNYNGIDNNLKVMIHCYYNFLNLVLLFLVLFLFATPQEKKINPVGTCCLCCNTYHILILCVFFCSAGPPYLLYFCVKFYAADPCRLHEELTRLVLVLLVNSLLQF